MRTIGNANGIYLQIPEDAYFSFYNSPYVGHRNQSSIDVYPAHNEWNGPAYSPIDGKIVKIRRIKMGKTREIETEDYDYALGIKGDENERNVIRILHCKPSVEIGEEVTKGEDIGSLLRSRYFNFWTGPHYHLEVMREEFFERASMSYTIERDNSLQDSPTIQGQDNIIQALWTIQHVTPDFILATSTTEMKGINRDIYGHVAILDNGAPGLIDAGFPHYRHGGVHGISEKTGEVRIDSFIIGMMKTSSFFMQNRNLKLLINGYKIRGISTYLYTKHQLIDDSIPLKIIPEKYNGFSNDWTEGDTLSLSLHLLE